MIAPNIIHKDNTVRILNLCLLLAWIRMSSKRWKINKIVNREIKVNKRNKKSRIKSAKL